MGLGLGRFFLLCIFSRIMLSSSFGLLIKIMFTLSSIYLNFLCLYSSSASFEGTDRRYYRFS